MVKADAKRNYYADLELTSTADTEEIKKQFRKLGEFLLLPHK
jgi:curved DNA-binding protein CbpA